MPDLDWRPELRRRLAPLRLPPVREGEIVDELAAHLDDRYREHLAGGVSDAQARRLALAELNDSDVLARRLGPVAGPVSADGPVIGGPSQGRLLSGFWQDVRYGLRSLRKNPGFAAAALLMLALGTGANAAMFSVVDAVLLRSPFRDHTRIVMVLDRRDPKVTHVLNAPLDELRQLQQTTAVFDSVSGFGYAAPILTGVGEPRRLTIECVSASMFRVLGIDPVLGRAFSEDEDRPGADPVMVLSDRLRRQVFGGGDAIGRSLTLDGHPVTVIGTMSAEFDGTRSLGTVDAWAPFGQGVGPVSAAGCQVRPGGFNVYARIRADLTLPAAEGRLRALTAEARGLISLDESTTGDDRMTLLMLLGAVSFVLLIASANVANLLLERAVRRRREIATRLALGASPGRLVRQVLTESVLLATLGTLIGWVAAQLVLRWLVSLLPLSVPHVGHIALNARVFCVSLLSGVAAGFLAGLVPALQASSRGLVVWLSDARAVTLPSRSWTRRALVVSEVALSVALLVGAALMIQSFLTVLPTHPGFDPSDKVVASMSLSGPRYQSPGSRLAFLEELTSRLRHLPGVRGVSAASNVPFGGSVAFVPITVMGRPDLADGHLGVFSAMVTANYFEELRMPVKRGRGFLTTDDTRAMPVAIVSETLARRLWPGTDPIGAQIALKARGFTFDNASRRVVGVVGDARAFGNTTHTSSQLYVPMAQYPTEWLSVVVRTDPSASDPGPDIRRAAAATDATQVLNSVSRFDDLLSRSVAPRRFVTWLMSAFAAMALGLATVGLTAVIGATVAQRTREIGIRMTLGARPGAVVRLVLRQAIALALGGVAIGLGLAAATTRLLADSLYGVTSLDPPTFATSAVLMLVVAIGASYVPARRATKVDPLVALRAE
jgi:predicted permease